MTSPIVHSLMIAAAALSMAFGGEALAAAKAPPAPKPAAAKPFANAAWADRSVRPSATRVAPVSRPASQQAFRKPDFQNLRLVQLKARPNAGGHALTRQEMRAKLSPPNEKNSHVVKTSQKTGVRYDFKGRPHNGVKTPHHVKLTYHASPADASLSSWRSSKNAVSSSKADLRIAQSAMKRAAPKKPR
jgi:hypothetical protein